MPSTVASPTLLYPDVFRDLPNVSAAFTTRRGGSSEAPFDSLNLGLHTDDAREAVLDNRRRVLAVLGYEPDRAAFCEQVHGADVQVVDRPGTYEACDGLVTTTPDLPLAIQVADCAAVLLADAEAGVVGACHAGWRGTVAGIAGDTIDRMRSLGAEPGRMRVYVSPCISVARFEVGPEVAAQFPPTVVHRSSPDTRPHVDLKAALRLQLHDRGIPPEQIEISPHCTASDTQRFYSYRAESGRTGRLMGLIVLNA